jgi:hypothetical protein
MDKAIEATDDSIIRRIRHFACWIAKATDTLRLWNTYCNNGYANSPQCDVIRTLPVLFAHIMIYDIYLLQLGFHPVAVVGKLFFKETRIYKRRKRYTKNTKKKQKTNTKNKEIKYKEY